MESGWSILCSITAHRRGDIVISLWGNAQTLMATLAYGHFMRVVVAAPIERVHREPIQTPNPFFVTQPSQCR
jgi:hypothetical protein